MLDGHFAQSPGEVRIVARIGPLARGPGELHVVIVIADDLHDTAMLTQSESVKGNQFSRYFRYLALSAKKEGRGRPSSPGPACNPPQTCRRGILSAWRHARRLQRRNRERNGSDRGSSRSGRVDGERTFGLT